MKTGFNIDNQTFFIEFEDGKKLYDIPIKYMANLFFILKDMLNNLGERQKINDENGVELLEQPPYELYERK